MRVMSVVGARPQFIKLAPVDQALRTYGFEHVIVHTGQHYDKLMSQAFFDDLAITPPDANLGIGSGSHAAQTAAVLTRLESILDVHRPDWVLVYGDTNSTLGGALATSQCEYPLAHLEAGLRSFDRRMPEERNRVVADHLADLLLAPTTLAAENLAAEGLHERTVIVGDVMVDALRAIQAKVASMPGRYLPESFSNTAYLLATLHRQETTDDPDRLAKILSALADCPLPVRLLAHPRLKDRISSMGLPLNRGALHVGAPLKYPSMIAALLMSQGLITDSGGLQKEALLLGVPCTTVRSQTEWPETLQDGWNVLVTSPGEIASAASRPRPPGEPPQPFGDGTAAERVVIELSSKQPHKRRISSENASHIHSAHVPNSPSSQHNAWRG